MKRIGMPLDEGDQWLQETVWSATPSGSTVRLIATDVSPSEFRNFPNENNMWKQVLYTTGSIAVVKLNETNLRSSDKDLQNNSSHLHHELHMVSSHSHGRPSNRTVAGSRFKMPQRFACFECGRSYKSRQNLHRHRKYECGKDPQFHCPFCSMKTKQKCSLLGHIKRKHGGVSL